MRRTRSLSLSFLSVGFALSVGSYTRAATYSPPPGYKTTSPNFSADLFAVSSSGRVAVASSGVIRVYSTYPSDPAATLLTTISSPNFSFLGGLTFADNDAVVFGENGTSHTIFSASVPANPATPSTITALAPNNSVPYVQDLTVKNGIVYATDAEGPTVNRIVTVPLAGGTATEAVSAYGSGYAGGITIDAAGHIFAGDDNTDPDTFASQPGRLYEFNPDFTLDQIIDLTAGNGTGAAGLAFDNSDNLYVGTGGTLTRVQLQADTAFVSQFGSFVGAFPFPSGLQFVGPGVFTPGAAEDPNAVVGKLLVNESSFASPGGVFAITPTPEPAAALIVLAFPLLMRRRFVVR